MEKSLALFFLAFITVSSCFGQRNLQAAYIVNNSNDTIQGFIDYREWIRNPSSISFTGSTEEFLQKLTVADVKGFCIIGKEQYRSLVVTISMNNEVIYEMTQKDTTSITTKVFLKILNEGRYISLYSYKDELKSRLYILSNNDQAPIELKNTEYMLNGQIASDEEYRMVLLSLAKKYAAANTILPGKIVSAGYYKDESENIINLINGPDKKPDQPGLKNEKPSSFRFWVGTGINKAQIKIDGENRYSDKTNNGPLSPLFAAGFDILFNPYVGKTYLKTAIEYSTATTDAYTFNQYSFSRENYYLKLKQKNITVYQTVNYNLYNESNLKFFIGAGVGLNFSSYPINEETSIREATTDTTVIINSKYISFIKKFWINGIIKTGVSIKNIEVALSYTTGSNVSNYISYTAKVSALKLQVSYIFRK